MVLIYLGVVVSFVDDNGEPLCYFPLDLDAIDDVFLSYATKLTEMGFIIIMHHTLHYTHHTTPHHTI